MPALHWTRKGVIASRAPSIGGCDTRREDRRVCSRSCSFSARSVPTSCSNEAKCCIRCRIICWTLDGVRRQSSGAISGLGQVYSSESIDLRLPNQVGFFTVFFYPRERLQNIYASLEQENFPVALSGASSFMWHFAPRWSSQL
jgi:hypothetical protein